MALIADGEDHDAGDGGYYLMGSIMVKPGCKLYMFYDAKYSGDRYELIS